MTTEEAFQTVYNLAENNALDSTDPDLDESLKDEAERQLEALGVFHDFAVNQDILIDENDERNDKQKATIATLTAALDNIMEKGLISQDTDIYDEVLDAIAEGKGMTPVEKEAYLIKKFGE